MGGVLSICVLLLSSLSIFLFTSELFYKRNPAVLSTRKYVNSSIVTMEEFPVILYLSDRYANPFSLDGFAVNISQHFNSSTTESRATTVVQYTLFEKCSLETNLFKYKDFLTQNAKKIPYEQSYCISPNKVIGSNNTLLDIPLAFENNFGDSKSQFIYLNLQFCTPSLSQSCNQTKIDLYKNRFYINVYYFDHIIDYSNNEDPFTLIISNHLQQLSYGVSKRLFLNIANTVINTDNGVIFSDISSFKSFTFSSKITDINLNNSIFFELTLNSPNYNSISTRSYLTLQSIIANIG
jgi:hypothetical protein